MLNKKNAEVVSRNSYKENILGDLRSNHDGLSILSYQSVLLFMYIYISM